MRGLAHKALLALAALAATLAAAPAARADYAVLRNGQRLHITGYQRSGDRVELQVAGGTVVLPAADVISVEPEETFQAAAPAAPPGPVGNVIRAAAERHGVDAALVRSLIAAESNFQPRAVSPKRAEGLMQLMPVTAARYGVRNSFDPAQNVDAGTRYLKDLLGQYHQNLSLALAAYNAGPSRVSQFGGVPPFRETRAYLRRVADNLAKQAKQKKAAPQSMICSPLRARCVEAPAGAGTD
jgi:soluble lytic murein transglycosylase-like protein